MKPPSEGSGRRATWRRQRSTRRLPSNLLFGATSILGYSIARQYFDSVLPFVTGANRAAAVRHWPVLNFEDPAWPKSIFKRYQPDLLLHCHAICDVAKCEVAPQWAREVNVSYLKLVLDALPQQTRVVYVSSDHVFGGDGVYDESSPPCPISIYGRTRVEAEELILNRTGSLVIRVGLPIGPSPNGRAGHWDWLRYRTQRKLPVTIVYDEYRSVVWASDLSARVMALAESTETGIRHVPATRVLSRVELADHLLKLFGEPASYGCESRHQRAAPHLGHVELATRYQGALFKPLASVLDQPMPYQGMLAPWATSMDCSRLKKRGEWIIQ